MSVTGEWGKIEKLIRDLPKLAQQQVADDIAARANDRLTADQLKIFDSRTDPATGAAWDDNLDGTPGDQIGTGGGRDSFHFVARPGARVRLAFADHLKWNLSWRHGQGHGGQHKQNFIPSMSRLPANMLASLTDAAREVFADYGFEFKP